MTARGVRPVDALLAGYAAVSAVALAFPHRGGAWPLLLAAHVVAILTLLRVGPAGRVPGRIGRRWPSAARTFHDWYPLALMPAMYAEIATLNAAVHGGRYFDGLVLGWEAALFGGQPSRTLAEAWPWLPVSEALHGAYLSYYLIIYGPPLLLYVLGRRPQFRGVVFAVMLTFVAHYVVFIYFPVQGPRYLFAPPDAGAIEGGAMYRLAHRILEAGSSRGAAFPSSHVAVAVAQTVAAGSALPWLVPLLAPLTAGLALGAVYGGFHYATDALAGLVAGLVLAAAAPRLRAALARRLGGTDP